MYILSLGLLEYLGDSIWKKQDCSLLRMTERQKEVIRNEIDTAEGKERAEEDEVIANSVF